MEDGAIQGQTGLGCIIKTAEHAMESKSVNRAPSGPLLQFLSQVPA